MKFYAQIPCDQTSFYSSPKHEMRGLFLCTHFRLDWPSSVHLSMEQQKQELIAILDKAKFNHYNAIFFQIRSTGDALYPSQITPWSRYLNAETQEGVNPNWDPLQFIITEAHSRGLELHAWLNPYRVKAGGYKSAPNHVYKLHPDWLYKLPSSKNTFWLNPGIMEVKNHVKDIVNEVITNYDVDGIHFDDYFYAKGITNQDEITYRNYANTTTNPLTKADWRRENTTEMMSMVYDAIQNHNVAKNKNVILGVSPFGVYKHNVPSIVSYRTQDCFNDQYYDPIKWLELGKVDYLAPQLYWPIYAEGTKTSVKTDFNILSDWWDEQTTQYNKQLYTALAGYKILLTFKESFPISNWPVAEIQNQIIQTRNTSKLTSTSGSIIFRASSVNENQVAFKGFNAILKANQYATKSFSKPFAGIGKDTICPNIPQNVRIENELLKWDSPLVASDGDVASKFVIYAFDNVNQATSHKDNSAKIVDITGVNQYTLNATDLNKYFVVSALDKNNNENGNFLQPVFKSGNSVLEAFKDVVVYPNPFENEFCIQINDHKNFASTTDWVHIEIVDLTCKKVFENDLEILDNKIFVRNVKFNSGVYFVTINYIGSSNKTTFKLIKE